jgi:hypothetical protein
MSIETLLTALVAAVEANTAALTGSKASAGKTAAKDDGDDLGGKAEGKAATGKAAAGKAAAAKTKSIDVETMQAALEKVKKQLGAAEAKAIITKFGKVAKMAEIEEDNYQAVFNACEKALNADAGDTGAGEDDGL